METFTNVTAPGSEGTFKGDVTVKDNPDDMFFTDYFYAVSPYPETFTDEGDVVIDPVAGSGSTLRAAQELGRPSYGFEVGKAMYNKVMESTMLRYNEGTLFDLD